ncbi:hypothetical protein K470DRAFT_51343 [Piedraia hortae CBS 480.64]|uniref:Uncharacterized protein n=1 Tax=Piedraia hortae CBS 480.64 TaxID=1314780 RepID=A0A6A7C963_9PEZI|nr:hypothetical protein K470DRAFT_51343 [Piedraia hortae CBS 480.64]
MAQPDSNSFTSLSRRAWPYWNMQFADGPKSDEHLVVYDTSSDVCAPTVDGFSHVPADYLSIWCRSPVLSAISVTTYVEAQVRTILVRCQFSQLSTTFLIHVTSQRPTTCACSRDGLTKVAHATMSTPTCRSDMLASKVVRVGSVVSSKDCRDFRVLLRLLLRVGA